MKRQMKTKGIDPKVPTQAIATIIVFVASKFGLEVDVTTSAAIAVVLGFIAGVLAPAPETSLKDRRKVDRGEGGFYDPIYIIVLLIVIVVLVYVIRTLLH